MKLSIVTITLNDLEGLKATRDSIRSQSFRDYEWIVIDGGSNDGTKEFLEHHSQETAYWCSEIDKGVYDAQNKGIRQATGDYLLFMNSGDCLYDADVLAAVFADNRRADILYGDWTNVKGETVIEEHKAPEQAHYAWFYTDNICHQAMFIRTTLLKESPYDTRFRIYADWAKWMELSRRGCTFEYIPRRICRFQLGGLSRHSDEDNSKEKRMIQEHFYPGSLEIMAETFTQQSRRCRSLRRRNRRLIRFLILATTLLVISIALTITLIYG